MSIECESVTKRPAIPSHIQIRHGFDHIARIEGGELTNGEIDDVLIHAKEHFKRGTIEACEMMIKYHLEIIDAIIISLRSSIFRTIGKRGTLYKNLNISSMTATGKFQEARKIKHDNFY